MDLFYDATDAPSIRTGALGAISCLVRGHSGLESAFTAPEGGGVDVLAACIESSGEDAQRQTKGLFLLRALVSSDFSTPELARRVNDRLGDRIVELAANPSPDAGSFSVDLGDKAIEALTALAASGAAEPLFAGHRTAIAAARASTQTASGNQDLSEDERQATADRLALWDALLQLAPSE
mmetsp:Transcript_21051/g.61416  ORF Transcript_21051/g.61416 Transcript_21051/m.61416 type:complete len:180 (+) Transcript_21051:659-1198(+)